MTEMIMLVGLPGCGKTTYAERTRKEFGYAVCSSDEIRKAHDYDIENSEVFDILGKEVRENLRSGIDCIYDATNMSRKKRMHFLNSLSKIKCRKVCVLFAVGISICEARNRKRHGIERVPDYVYDKMLNSFNIPLKSEGFDEVRVIFEYNYEKLPGEWYNMKHDNPHHRLTIGEHMMEAKEYICKHYPGNLLLEMAACYHDIGKVFTKSFKNYKGEMTDDAHFYGHENYGAYFFLTYSYMFRLAFTDDEILYIAALINLHMRPLTAWRYSEKSRERDKKLIGDGMYQDLLKLHEADLAAH